MKYLVIILTFLLVITAVQLLMVRAQSVHYKALAENALQACIK